MPYIKTQISSVIFDSVATQKKIPFYSDFAQDLVVTLPSWIESYDIEYTVSGSVIKGYIVLNAYVDAIGDTLIDSITVTSESDSTGYTLVIPVIYPFDPQHIKLTEAVDVAIELAGRNSYISRRDRSTAMLAAKRWLQDTPHACSGNVRMAESPIEENTKVYLPPDFVSFIAAYRVTSDGWLAPIYTSDKYNSASGYIQDNDRLTVTDNFGFVISGTGLTPKPQNEAPHSYMGETWSNLPVPSPTSGIYYIRGGIINYNGFVKYDDVDNCIYVDGIADEAIVIEYVSDPITRANKKLDEYGLRVHKNFQEALEKYVYWRLIEMNRSVPSSTRQLARKEYALAIKRARPVNINDLVQALRGINKGF